MRWLAWLSLLLGGAALGHPRHVTAAEAHWRPDRGVLEVSLRAPTDHLAAALRARGRRLSAPDASAALARLLEEQLRVVEAESPRPLRLIGHEVAPDDTWLYFEVPLTDPSAVQITHRLLFDQALEQLNLFTVHLRGAAHTLVFSAAHPTRSLSAATRR